MKLNKHLFPGALPSPSPFLYFQSNQKRERSVAYLLIWKKRETGKREGMPLVAREQRTHFEDVGDSGLRAEDQPGVGLDVGIFI